MKKCLFMFFFMPFLGFSQPNCNVFLYNKDTLQYKACNLVSDINDKYYQFSKEFQEGYDEAIKICPHFGYAYREKSVAYLKSGDFLTWKTLIDKAVKYDPNGNIGYRGWCRYQFFRDYKGAIADFELLESTVTGDIGYSSNGDYQLNIAKAMCYSALNQKEKAIEIFEKQLNTQGYSARLYDYFQLGVTYFEVKDYKNALKCLAQQTTIHEFADNAYYKCKIYKLLNQITDYEAAKKTAIQHYTAGDKLFDPYTHHANKVFYDEIVKE